MARLASVVDLPSAGSELVTTTTLRGWSTSTNCRFVRSCRKASDRGDCGSSWTVSGRFGVCGSNATNPRFGAPVSSRRCSGEVTDVSVALRPSAPATPSIRPVSRPSPTERGRPADEGSSGTAAASTTRERTVATQPQLVDALADRLGAREEDP